MANPIFNEEFLKKEGIKVLQGEPMTVNGTIQIAAFLGLLLLAAAYFVWSRYTLGYMDMVYNLSGLGLIAGFILALIISFTKNKLLIPVYAVCEGLALGGISSVLEGTYPGMISQAVAGTFAVLFSTLILYRANLIRCTDKFRSVIFIATSSIAVVYVVNFLGSFFHMQVPLLNSSSNLGIGVSILIIIIAALNLIIDFDFIERGARQMLPKNYEWYGAFGLMVTLVWLYLEILKLLARTIDRK